jgi:hypothetical protein
VKDFSARVAGSISKRNEENQLMAVAKKTAIKKLPEKAERIHANGKTRPVRDAKGHFVGSVSVKKIKDDLMHAIDDYKPPTKKLFEPVKHLGFVKKKESTFSLIKKSIIELQREKNINPPKPSAGRLTVYRVYSSSAGQGCGYYFTIKQSSPNEKSEPVMTLYNPATDLIALERAIKKYRTEQK